MTSLGGCQNCMRKCQIAPDCQCHQAALHRYEILNVVSQQSLRGQALAVHQENRREPVNPGVPAFSAATQAL